MSSMSRVAWLVVFASLSSIACAGSGADEGKEPAAPDDTASNAPGNDAPQPADVQPGTFLSDGADGLRLEMSTGATPRSYRCDNTCPAVCTDCLFEACMATGAERELCVRSRDACNSSCGLCPQGGTASACFSPCLKGEPTCYANLDLVVPDDVVRPDLTPEREPSTSDQTTPDETQPSNEGTPSSSASRGNSGRPAD